MIRCAAAIIAVLLAVHAARAGNSDALDALVAAYSDKLSGYDSTQVYWTDGTTMPVSDGVAHKSFRELLTNASILDQFRLAYPRGPLHGPPAVDFDPGRFRNEEFFRKLYGDCRARGTMPHLAPVGWLGHTIQVAERVAAPLAAVASEIMRLPEAVRRAAYPIAGTFNCRPVADTGRYSMHAYGAAIDLNTAYSDYWLWESGGRGGAIPYRNRMPQEIVDVFERHGFLWGGKWYHYDTMHFEYRPELLTMRP